MAHRNSAFAVICDRGRVLLVRTRRGWSLPGGGLKGHETPRDAVRREVEEETGLWITRLRLAGVYEREEGFHAFVFLARVLVGGKLPGALNEVREQRWIRLEKAVHWLGRSDRRRLLGALRPLRNGLAG